MKNKKLMYPWDRNDIESLEAGDLVFLSGKLYMARDAAHLRMKEYYIEKGYYPIDIKGQGIYYAGPAPARPGRVIGPAGPTTSGRMDALTPEMHDAGLLFTIGKGNRNEEVIESIKRNKCVYLAATGGTAALISKTIKAQNIVLYDDLGAEALREITVEDFPAIVIIDCDGNNLYESGKLSYRDLE